MLSFLTLFIAACAQNDSYLRSELESCRKRIEVLEQRQKLVEEMLDEALSKWDLVDRAVKRLEKFSASKVEVQRENPLMRAYADAYMKWYKGNYKEAVKALSIFIAKCNDRYLKQQAQLLLADSYWRIGKKYSACQVLEAFVKKYTDSIFYCSAYYKARVIRCKNIKVVRGCGTKD